MARRKSEKWMQEVSAKTTKGGLHKSLGIAPGKKIGAAKVEKATHSRNPLTKKQAVLAENYAKARKKK